MAEDAKNQEKTVPELKSGMVVKIHQKIKELNTKGEEKERIQIFEGTVLATKGGRNQNATFTVRKIAEGGIGVERIFPLFSPNLAKIEVVKQLKTRQSKLYYLRTHKKTIKEKKKNK